MNDAQSRHLINVFKEAKSAYHERKAEIVAGRRALAQEKRGRHSGKAYTIDDDQSSNASRHNHQRNSAGSVRRKPTVDRTRSGDSTRRGGSSTLTRSRHGFEDSHENSPRSLGRDLPRRHTTRHGDNPHTRSPTLSGPPQEGLIRRHTMSDAMPEDTRSPPSPAHSLHAPEEIDMDLAYGEMPAPMPLVTAADEEDLKGLVGKVKQLLDEADCVQYSATAIIANLQRNPDAMAAVALTLAEISNLVSKMAPSVVMSMKGAAPAVFALLASPQFLIAAGVGVGVTIVAFGGYKIIKKIKAKHATEDLGMDEMLEHGGDINRIDSWRRGISEAEEQSIDNSVEGEFISPQAAAMSRLSLNDERIQESRLEAKAVKRSKSSRGNKSSNESKPLKTTKGKKEKKEKKPSHLRLMFS